MGDDELVTNSKVLVILLDVLPRQGDVIVRSLVNRKFTDIIGITDKPGYSIFSLYMGKKVVKVDTFDIKNLISALSAILERLCLERYQCIVLLPISTRAVYITLLLKNFIETHYNIKAVSYDMEAVKLTKKSYTYKLAEKLGVKVPRWLRMHRLTPDTFSHIEEQVGVPFVIKRDSDSSRPIFIFSKEHFDFYLRKKVLSLEETYIAQEFIAGYGVGYFALAHKGVPVVEYAHKRIFEVKPSGGASFAAHLHFDPKVVSLGRKIISEIKYTGPIMIEFKKDYETGEYYLMEINPRFWGSLELGVRAGFNLPYLLLELLLNKNIDKRNIKIKQTCMIWLTEFISLYLIQNIDFLREVLGFIRKFKPYIDIYINDIPITIVKLLMNIRSMIKYSPNLRKKLWEQYMYNYKILIYKLINMRPKVIIFDLDGTIAHLNINWGEVRKVLVRRGLLGKEDDIFSGLLRLRSTNQLKFETASKIIEKYELKSLDNVRPIKGVNSFIKMLHKKGYKLALVTKQSKNVALSVLQKLGVKNFFDAIVSRELALKRHEQISLAKNILKLENHINMMVIGDSIIDAKASARHHACFIGITESPYRFQQMTEYGIFVVKDYDSLKKIIPKSLI